MPSNRALLTVALAVSALALLVEPAPPAHASTITVTTTADQFGTGSECSLREAIQAANSDAPFGGCPAGAGADTIMLTDGVYELTISGRLEDANATGDLDLAGAITISGAGAATTFVQSGPEGVGRVDRVFDVQPGASAIITGVTIRYGNPGQSPSLEEASGGGIRTRGTLILDRATVRDNQTASFVPGPEGRRFPLDDGGGIYVQPGGGLAARRSTIASNATQGTGGGISWNGAGALLLDGVTIADNVADTRGGGVALHWGTASIVNSTVSGNRARFQAAGISNEGSTLAIEHSTVVFNIAPIRSGVENNVSKPISFRGTIVARNDGGDCAFFDASFATSLGSNLASDASCRFNTPSDRQNIDPVIGPLQSNGGPTSTHALLQGSPAIDAVVGTCTVSADQRGISRPVDGDGNGSAICDIGAFEVVNPGTLQFSAPTYGVSESAGSATIVVTRTGGSNGAVSARLTTSDGTATQPDDYTALSTTVSFADGDSAPKTVPVPIVNDTTPEPNETVNLTLDGPTGNASIGAPSMAELTILDSQSPQLAATCTPRPRVGVQVASAAGGLQVTVSATTGLGAPSNRLTGLAVTIPANVRVDVAGGPSDLSGQQSIDVGDGDRPVVLLVRRIGSGAVTIPAIVSDVCGPWRTFFGAGAGGL